MTYKSASLSKELPVSLFEELVGAGDMMAKTILSHFVPPVDEATHSPLEIKRAHLISQNLIDQYSKYIDARGAIVAQAETISGHKLSASCHKHASVEQTMSTEQVDLEVRLMAYGALLQVVALKKSLDQGTFARFQQSAEHHPIMISVLQMNEYIMGYILTSLQLLLEPAEPVHPKNAYRPIHKIAQQANAELAAARL